MRLSSIRSRILLNSLALTLLPLTAFTAYSFWYVYSVNPDDFPHLLFILSGAFVVTSIAAIILSVNLAEKLTSPLEILTTAARRIAAGRLSERVHVRSGSEIDILALALNNLASRLEDKLDEVSAEKQKLHLILEHMDNAVMVFDHFGCLVEANRSSFVWFQISPAMLGQHNLNVLGSSQIDSALKEALQSNRLQQHTLRTHFQNTKKVFQVSLAALPSKGGMPASVLAVFHDITNLQLLQERQSDFVANASHEMSTPLTAIRGFAETLVDGASENAEDSLHFARIILSEAERMQRLVQDLLQLAKIDSVEYQQQLRATPTHVQPLLESVVRELSPAWKRKQLAFTVEQPQQPLWVLADPDRLKQVLVNLMDNAVKYTPNGGAIAVTALQNQDWINFEVKDSGIGIPPEDLPRIFDRFYRIDRARSRSIVGTGLGLAIVKHILDALGGAIDVESRLDAGTTFRFSLPSVDPLSRIVR